MTPINPNDELRLTARERGHRYGVGDVIFATLETDDRECTRIHRFVRYDSVHGGFAYFDERGEPYSSDWYLVAWRYATDEEVAAFEAPAEESPADWHDRRDRRAGRFTP